MFANDLRQFANETRVPVVPENCPAYCEAQKERHRRKSQNEILCSMSCDWIRLWTNHLVFRYLPNNNRIQETIDLVELELLRLPVLEVLSSISNYSTASTALLHTSASHNAFSSIQGSTLNSPISSGSNNSSTTHLLVPVGSGSCSSQTALIPSLVDSESPPPGRRQTSWDLLDQNTIAQAKQQQQKQQYQITATGADGSGAKALFKTHRSLFQPPAISDLWNVAPTVAKRMARGVNPQLPTL